MLIQLLLDYMSQVLADPLIESIPPFPPEVATALAGVQDGMTYLSDQVFALGILVPFEALAIVIGVWQAVLVIWAGILLLRVVLRIVGR